MSRQINKFIVFALVVLLSPGLIMYLKERPMMTESGNETIISNIGDRISRFLNGEVQVDEATRNNQFYQLIYKIGDIRATRTDASMNFDHLLVVPAGSSVKPYAADLEALGFKPGFGYTNRVYGVGVQIHAKALQKINHKFVWFDRIVIFFDLSSAEPDAQITSSGVRLFTD